MSDQAAQLRNLAQRASTLDHGDGPRVLVVAGGRPGVGATTLATEVATTWGAEALRVVLIDADLERAEIAQRCGIVATAGIGDVLLGRRSIHETLQRGPVGIQVLPGSSTAETRGAVTDRTLHRLVKQIRTLKPHADWVVIDGGSQPSEIASRLWQAAERVVLVTSPEAPAIMETYALIKTQVRRRQGACPIDLAVSRADEAIAADVHRRMDQSCRRFLGLGIGLAGTLPKDASSASLSSAIEQLAHRLLEKPQQHAERSVA